MRSFAALKCSERMRSTVSLNDAEEVMDEKLDIRDGEPGRDDPAEAELRRGGEGELVCEWPQRL